MGETELGSITILSARKSQNKGFAPVWPPGNKNEIIFQKKLEALDSML
jgi:hypothetical protein